MNLVMKLFFGIPVLNFKTFFDFKKTDEVIELQKQASDQMLRLHLSHLKF